MSQSVSLQKNSSLSARQRKTLPLHDFPTLGELMESPSPEVHLRAIRTAVTCSTKLNELRKLGDDVQALSDALYINNNQEKYL